MGHSSRCKANKMFKLLRMDGRPELMKSAPDAQVLRARTQKKKTAEVIRHRPKRRARGSQPAKISELHLHPTGPGCRKTQREILRCSGRCIVGWGDSHDNQFRLSIKPEEKTPGVGGGGDLMDVAGLSSFKRSTPLILAFIEEFLGVFLDGHI